MSPDLIYGITGLVFVSIFLMFFGLDRLLNGQNQNVEDRLERYAHRLVQETNEPDRRNKRGSSQLLEKLGSRGDGNKKLAADLGRADLRLTPGEFIAVNLVIIFVAALIAYFISRGNLIFALLAGVIGFYAPRGYLRYLQGKRLSAFNNQLSDSLILLANSLRAGYSLLQAMETASRELPPPISVEFARIVREIGLGLTIQEALAHGLERIPSEDFDFVVTAINVQHETGGNLSEILDTISHTIRERVRIKGQIQAMTATQRMSGNVVAILPIALGVFMFIFNPQYLSRMWEQQCGVMMLIFGVITITSGWFAIQKITDIEV